jgi:type IV pilus assembly protein PilM
MCRVLLAFAHRDLVDRHADACQKAGLKLVGIDLDAFALLRSLSEPRAADSDATQAVVAVAIGHERTVFAVSDGLICDFVRVLEWGGGALDTAIAHSLDLSIELAHAVKHQLVLADGTSEAPDGLSPVQGEAARAAVRDELRVLSQEIVSSLRFYQTRAGSLAIGELLLTGGGSELPGLAEELERTVGVPVRAADPLGRVQLGKRVKRPAEAGSFAVAIGLGIEA